MSEIEDLELRVLSKIVALLDTLSSPNERERVLKYLLQRYDILT